jgi:orotidine-5'-phosphate decarboxylase
MFPKLCVALDTEREKALNLAKELKDFPIILKVGYKLFIPYGVDIVKELKKVAPNLELFLDLKLHDIPNTVRNGVIGANQLGVNYLTIHSLGGKEMIEKAAEVKGNLKLLGVTLLTSHDEGYLNFLGIKIPKEEFVLKLAQMATSAGCDGLVCSAEEVKFLKENLNRDFIAVVPGIRLEKIEGDDQKRVATPEEAIERGADIIVVGRPVVNAEKPIEVVEEILKRIGY